MVLSDVQYVDRSKVRSSQLLRKGDILVCTSSGSKGLVGKAALVKRDVSATFGAFCCVLRSLCGEADYLGHYFQSGVYRRTTQEVCYGSNINNLKPSNFYSLTVPIYVKSDRERIVNILDLLANLIELSRCRLSLLDDLVKSRFVEMFGDLTRRDQFNVKCLGEIYQIKSSKRIYAKELTKEGVPFYRLADIASLIDDKKPPSGLCIAEGKYLNLKEAGYVPAAGDILVTSRGTLGRCYVVSDRDRFYFQDGMITWLSKTEKSPLSAWLVELFSNSQFVKQLNDSCSGTTVKYLSITDLQKVRIPLPPLSLQKEFAAFAERVGKSRVVVQQQVLKYNDVKASSEVAIIRRGELA